MSLRKLFAALAVLSVLASVFCVFVVPFVGADPANVKVVSYSWYIYPCYGKQGDVIVVGEVQNIGSTVIDHINLEGTIYSPNGTKQGLTFTTVKLAYLEPGAKSPFYMDFYYMNSESGAMDWVNTFGVDHVEFRVAYAGDTTDHAFSGVVVASNSSIGAPVGGAYAVSGTLKNTASAASPNLVYTVTTFYNASGTVVAVNMTGAPARTTGLAPGETMSFSAVPSGYWLITSQITSYTVAVQCEVYNASTSSPDVSSSPSVSNSPNTSSPGMSPSGSAGPTKSPETGGNGQSMDMIYALVGAVAIVVIVVAGVFFWRRGR